MIRNFGKTIRYAVVGAILLVALTNSEEIRDTRFDIQQQDNKISKMEDTIVIENDDPETTESAEFTTNEFETTESAEFTTNKPETTETVDITTDESGTSGPTSKGVETTPEVKTTPEPTKATIYIRTTLDEFKKIEESIKKLLAKIFNERTIRRRKRSPRIRSNRRRRRIQMYNRVIDSSDITISATNFGGGYLKLDITIQDAGFNSAEAKDRIHSKQADFEAMNIEMTVDAPNINPNNNPSGGLEGWKIALIVIGCFVGVLLIISGAYIYNKRRTRVYQNILEMKNYSIN